MRQAASKSMASLATLNSLAVAQAIARAKSVLSKPEQYELEFSTRGEIRRLWTAVGRWEKQFGVAVFLFAISKMWWTSCAI